MDDRFFKNLPLTKFDFHKNFENFENSEIFYEIRNVLFYNVHKENMFTIEIKDGREGSKKTSIANSNIIQ